MALSEIFFLAIAFYLLYRFVFNFLVPVARTTKHVRQQFKSMNEMQQEAMRQQQEAQNRYEQSQQRQTQSTSRQRPAQKDDYIDFEEIKD